MDTERPPPHRQPPDRASARPAGDGDLPNDNASLGHHIVARYGHSPGVIPMEATLQRFRRTGLFGHDRLPVLTRLSGRWGGISLPYPGSSGPLTFLRPSPFASAEFAGAKWIGRPTESVSSRTVNPEAPLSVLDTPRQPLPIAHKAEKRMISKEAGTPAVPAATEPGSIVVRRRRSQPEPLSPVSGNKTPARHPEATEPGSAVVRRQKSQPEALSPDSGDETPARQPEATGTATVAPVETRVDGPTPGLLPLSPTHAGLGRAIIRRRKHPFSEPSPEPTAPVTTETRPQLWIGPRTGQRKHTVGRAAMPLPLPVGSGPPPSTRVSAQALPTPAPRSTSRDLSTGAADVFPSGAAKRENSSPIETPDTAASRGDLGTAILLRHARTTIAAPEAPQPASKAPSRQSGPSQIDRSLQKVRILTGNPPDGWATAAGTAMTTLPPTMAHRVPQPQAASLRSRAEQLLHGRPPGSGSRPVDRLPVAAPPAHPTISRALTVNTRPSPKEPGAGIGFTDALSTAQSTMPLAVQRQGQGSSEGLLQSERLPTSAWQTGDAGRSPPAISAAPTSTGYRSGSLAAIRIEDPGAGSETEPNQRADDGERPNVDDLVDKVLRKLMRRLAIEQERRGRRRWF